MSIASRNRAPPPMIRSVGELSDPLREDEPPFIGREELNTWRPDFDNQLANDLAEHEDGEGELEEDGIPRRRVLWGIPPAHVPSLGHRHLPAAHSLTAELITETAGRDRFQTVTPSGFLNAAETFPRYRLTSLDIIRHADMVARRMSLSDLRDIGRRSFAQMQLAMQLMSHFAPQIMKSRANANDPLFAELVIPGRLRNFPADLSQMGHSSSRTS